MELLQSGGAGGSGARFSPSGEALLFGFFLCLGEVLRRFSGNDLVAVSLAAA